MIQILLVNREVGTSRQIQPVCGASGKLYGQAAPDTSRNGMAYRMSLEEYNAARIDIISNRGAGQLWVPEILVTEDPATSAFKDGVLEVDGVKFSEAFFQAFLQPSDHFFKVTRNDMAVTIQSISTDAVVAELENARAEIAELKEQLKSKTAECRTLAAKKPKPKGNRR